MAMAEEFEESDIVFNGGNYIIENNEDYCLKKWFTDSSDDELRIRAKRKKLDDKKPKPMSIPKRNHSLAWLRYIEPRLILEYEYEDEDEMVPPHVMIRRRLAEKMAFSVCSGMGRTLKGRDLSEMRNSVLRMTGFLET
uniref:uncharacterized protein LOC122594655 n=1 Tax=Erigeron canadensis TaxID=72917 RepID=UPI001CB95E1E|nr:uncharacterized protein LOC122594655 [Erigeron canadensis]